MAFTRRSAVTLGRGQAGDRSLVRFCVEDCDEQLGDFAARYPHSVAEPRGRAFVDPATGARLVLPFVLTPPSANERPADYRARWPERMGRRCLLLLQAGAFAVGYWDDGELIRHKAGKRYVVRGNGKAQSTHQKTRGKSRYGSRLRLQNWQRLLSDVNHKLCEWWRELGIPEQCFFAVPVRSMADLFAADPSPPIARDDARIRRVPVHVHVPDFSELKRVDALLQRGRLEVPHG